MDLYLVPVKKIRLFFFFMMIISVLMIGLSYILSRNGIMLVPGYKAGEDLTGPVLIAIVIISVIHALNQRKHLNAIGLITDFDVRVKKYEKFYKRRVLWWLLSITISCGLYLLSLQLIFLFYAGIDLLLSLPFYPSSFLLKRELRNKDIIIY